jgi:hypothetical protein
MLLSHGDRIDRYILVAKLGEGGQGEVWKAKDPLNHSFCALKVADIAGVPSDHIERIRREARALGKLDHPSLPRCGALFEDLGKGIVGFTMDFVDGSPLSAALRDPRLAATHRSLLLTHITTALGHLHERGIVHRDLKPENVLVASDFWASPRVKENVKLVDFGIASADPEARRLTAPGMVIGTPPYMAPEQIEPTYWGVPKPTPATDVFALGVLVWEIFVGGHPTGLPDTAGLAEYAIAYRRAAESSRPWPPPQRLTGASMRVVERCLILRPAERFQSAIEVLAFLREAKERERKRVAAEVDDEVTHARRSAEKRTSQSVGMRRGQAERRRQEPPAGLPMQTHVMVGLPPGLARGIQQAPRALGQAPGPQPGPRGEALRPFVPPRAAPGPAPRAQGRAARQAPAGPWPWETARVRQDLLATAGQVAVFLGIVFLAGFVLAAAAILLMHQPIDEEVSLEAATAGPRRTGPAGDDALRAGAADGAVSIEVPSLPGTLGTATARPAPSAPRSAQPPAKTDPPSAPAKTGTPGEDKDKNTGKAKGQRTGTRWNWGI